MEPLCKRCGERLDYQGKYCGYCGLLVPEEYWKHQAIDPRQTVSDDTLFFCEKCGSIICADRYFCTACGTSLHNRKRERKTIERKTTCAITIDASELNEDDRASFEKYLRGYTSHSCLMAMGAVRGELAFQYDINRYTVIDALFFKMVELLFSDIKAKFPRLKAHASCRYDPNPEALSKGFDDFGGYWDIWLEDGELRKDDCAII